MFNFRTLLKLLVFAYVLVATALAVSPPPSTNQPSPDAMKTALQPDLTLHTTLSVSLLPQEMNNPGKTGFCLGACTVRCSTNADCGPGGLCRPFIICGNQTVKIELDEGIGLSSHRGEMPVLNVKCK